MCQPGQGKVVSQSLPFVPLLNGDLFRCFQQHTGEVPGPLSSGHALTGDAPRFFLVARGLTTYARWLPWVSFPSVGGEDILSPSSLPGGD